MIYILVCLIVGVIFMFLLNQTARSLRTKDEEKNVLEMRKAQSKSSFRHNQLKRKLESLLEERASKSKRNKIEEMCLQAGFDISYGEYRLIGIFSGIIFFIAVLVGMHNLFLAIVLGFIGNIIPGQLIHTMQNRRLKKIEEQVGSFMRLVIERYASTKDFAKAIQDSTEDFVGLEPMYTELKRLSADINLGQPVSEAMKKFSKRVGNKYLYRLTDYYEIASDLGTMETRERLLKEAITQYEENRTMKSKLRNELNGPVREAYMMTAVIPFIGVYMAYSTPGYTEFMFHTRLGQFALSAMVVVLLGVLWFINKQIAKPLD